MREEQASDHTNDARPTLSDVEIMWRCLKCGELWPNSGAPLPAVCRNCGAAKTEFELLRED